MRNWIRTDIDIGYRIKCFDLDYHIFRQLSPRLLEGKWDAAILEMVFDDFKKKGCVPKTGALVRISMSLDRMCVRFWVQDNSFKPLAMGESPEIENIIPEKKKEGK